MAILSFADAKVQLFFEEEIVPKRAGWSSVARIVTRKLDMIDYARTIRDLKSPPANHLEALRGDLRGWHSIRVNDQWRVIFRWTDTGAVDVDVVDYH